MERPLYISKVEKQEDSTVISYRYLDMDNTFNPISAFFDEEFFETKKVVYTSR